MHTSESRKHKRVTFSNPQKIELHIRRVHGAIVKVKKTVLAYAYDISTGGIRFRSQINLPIGYLVQYRVPILVDEKFFSLEGVIVRKKKVDGEFEYGMEFDYSDFEDYRRFNTHMNVFNLKRMRES